MTTGATALAERECQRPPRPGPGCRYCSSSLRYSGSSPRSEIPDVMVRSSRRARRRSDEVSVGVGLAGEALQRVAQPAQALQSGDLDREEPASSANTSPTCRASASSSARSRDRALFTSFCFDSSAARATNPATSRSPPKSLRELLEKMDTRRRTGRCGNRLLSPGQQLIDQRFVPRFRAALHRLQLQPLDGVERDGRRAASAWPARRTRPRVVRR